MLESGASERAIVELLESRGWTKEDALAVLSFIEKEKRREPFLEEASDTSHTRHLPDSLSLSVSALSLVRENAVKLALLSFLGAVLYAVLYVVFVHISTHDAVSRLWENVVAAELSKVTTLPLLALALVFSGMFVLGVLSWFPASCILALSDTTKTLRQLLVEGWKGGFRLFFSSILYLLVVIGGLLLFFIPGILVGVGSIFAPLIAARERIAPFQALLVSRELVREHFLAVALRALFLVIPTALFILVLYLLFYLLFLLTSPEVGASVPLFLFVAFAVPLLFFAFLSFVFAYQVALYEALRARVSTVVVSKQFTTLLSLLLVVSFVVSLVVAFIAVVSGST